MQDKRKIFLAGLLAIAGFISISGCPQEKIISLAENDYGRKTSREQWQRIKENARFVVAPEFGAPKNIGSPVNTSGQEDSASISADGRTLLFAYVPYDVINSEKEQRPVISGPFRAFQPEDLVPHNYISTLGPDGKWSEPKLLEFSQNGVGDAGPELSYDSQKIYFTGPGENAKPDIWVSEFKGGWSSRRRLSSLPNSDYGEEDPAISKDEDELIFWSGDRPGGLGGPDLWISKQVNGEWQEPVNLGPPVNTSAVDYQPFLSWDGKELYFTSTRDGIIAIYRSKRDQAGNWQIPEVVIKAEPSTGVAGVGEPTLTADGKYLYFLAGYVSPEGEYDADILYVERKMR